MKRCIITYAEGPHEELLEVARPGYEAFALRHNYDFIVGKKATDFPPAWNKIPLLIEALHTYEEVVWFDCDLIVRRNEDDFPPFEDKLHCMVRHFEDYSEVPNSGVWRLRRTCSDLFGLDLLRTILKLEVFRNHGWWEQAALLTLMGYTIPPEGSNFSDTKCRNVQRTKWYNACQFMRLSWNSHPNYRAENPRIIHCSYPDMTQRLEVMKELTRDPNFSYPRYDGSCGYCKGERNTDPSSDEVLVSQDEHSEHGPPLPQEMLVPEEKQEYSGPVLTQETVVDNKSIKRGAGKFKH